VKLKKESYFEFSQGTWSTEVVLFCRSYLKQ